ncbi:MAG TPA: tetratricopeptide repeat protein [Hyphomicrobiaceae bacterium]|nr:tetratricopeptide repeat protein [Hyphomicrobiaceae bacterium]
MSKVWLEVAEDKSRPEGGHAIIRLHGVAGLTTKPSFSIHPLDGDGPSQRLVTDQYEPISSRETSEGTELVVGPDVVDNPALLPGTPVAIEVPSVGVRAEVLWPSITPLARQRKQPVIMTTARRLSLVQASRDQTKKVAPRIEVAEGIHALAGGPAPLAGRLDVVVPLPMALSASAAAAPLSMEPQRHLEAEPVLAALAVPLSSDGGRPARPAADHRGEAGPAPLPEPAPASASTARPSVSDSVVAKLVEASNPPTPVATAPYYPIQRYEPPQTDKVGRRLSGIAMMMALLAIGSSLLVLQLVRSMRAGPQMAMMTPVIGNGDAALPVPPSTLFDIFSVGTKSPSGKNAASIDAAKALAMADTLIHSAGSPSDLKEGEFWIKRALTLSLADERSRWALTQLGSLYAAPTEGDPNYERARLLWEMSAALGDPVAMCFLGSLHQHGLGVPASRGNALKWFELARQTGGCKGLDDLVAKLKR